jgi:hypothetical protein
LYCDDGMPISLKLARGRQLESNSSWGDDTSKYIPGPQRRGIGGTQSNIKYLHRIGATRRSRWRAAVPFLVPVVVQSFPSVNAAAPVNNQNPVFYIQATAIAALYPTFDSENIRLLRLRTKHDHREIPVSKGVTTFTFAPAIPSKSLVPISLTPLSETVIELKPRDPLSPGQYLITIGPRKGRFRVRDPVQWKAKRLRRLQGKILDSDRKTW